MVLHEAACLTLVVAHVQLEALYLQGMILGMKFVCYTSFFFEALLHDLHHLLCHSLACPSILCTHCHTEPSLACKVLLVPQMLVCTTCHCKGT